MILTDIEIRDMVKNFKKYNLNNPLISDFNEKNLQSSSYDISITNKINIYKKNIKSVNLLEQNLIDSIYEEIDISEGYKMTPGEYILVTLKETINLPTNICAHIRPRTKFTRLGLILSAQHCNQTYSGVLQLGLYNATPYNIDILPNLKVGQIVFEELKSIPSENKWYKNLSTSAYNNETFFIGSKISEELKDEANVFYKSLIKKLSDVNNND